MHLLVGAYKPATRRRQDELLGALAMNLACSHVEAVHVFDEDGNVPFNDRQRALLQSSKVTLHHRNRMTYADYLEFSNSLPTGTCCALVNADCYFDETMVLLRRVDLKTSFVCLSRQNNGVSGPEIFPRYSQDAWTWQVPVLVPPEADFELGMKRCDHRIALLMDSLGYRCVNPSLSVKLHHLHASQERGNAPTVYGLGAGVTPEEVKA